jgi:hypothetical protein
MRSVELTIHGPFGWGGDEAIPSVYDRAHRSVTSKGGVYLWTILTPDGDELVNYVGQTRRSFAMRFQEHEVLQSTGCYHIYDPDSYVQGRKKLLWGGEYGDHREPEHGFDSRFKELKSVANQFMKILRFHLAPISDEQTCLMEDDELRSRVEAALAHHFYAQGGVVGGFQDDDVEYLKESRLGKVRLRNLRWPPPDASTKVICQSECRIRSFPREVII